MRIMRLHQSRLRLGIVFLLLVLAAPTGAFAGDTPTCKSTQVANDLRSCPYCREVKRILSDPEIDHLTSFEVTGLNVGATVEIHATSDAARLLVQDFVKEMWEMGEVPDEEHVCDFCRERRAKLGLIVVDWAYTDDGVELVLVSQDHDLAAWALEDALNTQGWVLSAVQN
jgi:hypothetical protein